MDKTWLSQPRHTNEYVQGVDKFIEFAFINSTNGNKILCPCKICLNSKWRVATEVRDDLICKGFMEGYHTWLFLQVLMGVKFPQGFAADIRRYIHVAEKKIFGLKSHDNHILLQHLLPLAIRKILPTRVCAALTRVSNFFKKICSPVIRISDMQILEAEIAETLSILETIFLPSFFDVMVHLMVHLPAQVRIGGPVHFRSMWSVERYLGHYKGHVRTRSHPEGSITEGYLFDESLTYCSRYLKGCETRFTRQDNNVEEQEQKWQPQQEAQKESLIMNSKNRNVVEVLRKQNENMKRTLNLKGLADAYELEGLPAPRKKKKRQKRTPVSQTQAPERQLRSTSRLTTEIITEPEVVVNEPEGQEREVRKVTAMKSIWGWQNKPKLKLEINEYGQPWGKSATRFANFVGTQIRTKGFPVEFDDWRKVDLLKKLALWTEAKNIRTREASNTEEGNAILEDVAESNAIGIGRRVVNVEKPDKQQGGGRDVILYSITRPLSVAVAKGTIQTTNPKAVVGGEPLGSQFVEIVVHSVFKRETQLPHRMEMCLPWQMLRGNQLHGHLL